MDFVRIEQLADMVTQSAFSFQRRAEDPIPVFRSVVGKIASVFSMLLRIVYLALLGSFVAITSNEVAARLFLSQETVRTHLRTAMRKLGADTRVQAVVVAIRERLIG